MQFIKNNPMICFLLFLSLSLGSMYFAASPTDPRLETMGVGSALFLVVGLLSYFLKWTSGR